MKIESGRVVKIILLFLFLALGFGVYANQRECRVWVGHTEFLDENTFEVIEMVDSNARLLVVGEKPQIVANANGDGLLLVKKDIPGWVRLADVTFLTASGEKEASPVAVAPLMADYGNAIGRTWIKLKNAFRGEMNGLMLTVLLTTLILSGVGIWYFSRIIRYWNDGEGVLKSGTIFVFQGNLYIVICSVCLMFLLAFVASVLVLFLFGGLTWLVFWIIKLLLYIVLIVGGLALIAGILGLIAKEGWGCLPLIVGGVICSFSDAIEAGGEWLVNVGFNFMQQLNMFQWGLNIFTNYWDVMLLVVLTPLTCLLSVALAILTLCAVIILTETLVNRLYSAHFYCPKCGTPVGQAAYVDNNERIVFQRGYNLSPGVHGIFHHRGKNGRKYPTMAINGKLKLKRECTNRDCQGLFVPVGGTDIHIGIVGNRSVGKTYLLYSGLKMLQEKYKGNFKEEDVHADNIKIEDAYQRISKSGDVQTRVKNDYRALQVMYKKFMRLLPWHLYFYDVAGEKFDSHSDSYRRGLMFYRNVQSIVFLIDPCMVDFTGMSPDARLLKWVQQQRTSGEKYKVNDVLATMIKTMDIVDTKMNLKTKVDFNFVLVKKDMGYWEEFGLDSEHLDADAIKGFMYDQLGMHALVDTAETEFRSVGFYTVSVTDKNSKSLFQLFSGILKQRGINIK